jgi:outer membrane protein OmpA-like peptidoglycan-associated protein
MPLNRKLAGTLLAAVIFMLNGCNSNQPKSEEPQVQSTAATTTTTDSRPLQVSQPPAKPPVVVPNPSTIAFQKMAVTLDASAKQTIAQLAERAHNSRKVTLTGFCDRSQIANPSDAAVARAVAVRDELVALGVAPANMLVKFDIKVPKKHAVEVRFD